MGERYLTDLADVCRRAGYSVIEVDGWQRRARGSGGYDPGQPAHLMVHHTASGPSSDGWPDVNYCCYGNPDSPVGNLYLARTGDIYVMAAGAANTNGTGQDPCDIVADDAMNARCLAIEAGNDGTGETWPTVQQDAYVVLCRVLLAAYAIPVAQLHAHFEWAPGRKIDPAGQSRYAAGAAMWDMDAFRADVAATPPPPPPTEDTDEMLYVIAEGRGPTLVGPLYRRYAHTDDEAIVIARVYGDPLVLSTFDYDVLVGIVTTSDGP